MNQEVLDIKEIEVSQSGDFQDANKGKRFANYIIDQIGMMLVALVVGTGLGVISESTGNTEWIYDEDPITSRLTDWGLGIIISLIYFIPFEYFTKGKTLGKLVTKTRAIHVNNERLDIGTTAVRTLCRLVPFEAFSYLGNSDRGWHDRWSKTRVIEDRNWEDQVNIYS